MNGPMTEDSMKKRFGCRPARPRGALGFGAWSLFMMWALGPVVNVAYSDEGMWLLNRPPRDLLRTKYGFDVTAPWLERVQKASVRFNNGGSGSFVAPDGLVLTNHHIGADCLQKLSPKDKDYYRDGFYARDPSE